MLEPALGGSTVVLVDTNAEALDLMTRFTQRLNQALDAGLAIEATTDRRQALPEADFIITSVAVARMATWKKDFSISPIPKAASVWPSTATPTSPTLDCAMAWGWGWR